MSKPVIIVEDLGKPTTWARLWTVTRRSGEKIASIGKDVATRVRQKFTEVGRANDAFWAIRHANI